MITPYFSRSEFRCPCGCILADPHPVLVVGLHRLREMLRAPVIITSGSRCFGHNRRPPTERNERGVYGAGGAEDSQHLPRAEHDGYTCAADIVVEQTPLAKLFRLAEESWAFGLGGIGVYVDDTPRLHVDVRGVCGIHRPARWAQIDGRPAAICGALDEDERRRL